MENHRLQALYWAELVQLKVGCEYIRRYRDRLGALGERATELDTQARQLENLTAQPGA